MSLLGAWFAAGDAWAVIVGRGQENHPRFFESGSDLVDRVESDALSASLDSDDRLPSHARQFGQFLLA